MRWTRLERLAPLTGIVAVAFWVLAVVVLEAIGDTPDDSAPATEIRAYFDEEQGTIFAGSVLFGVGTAFFLWFLGSLRAALREAEGPPGRLSAIAFGAGVGMQTLLLAFIAPTLAGAAALDYLDRDLSPEAAEALFVIGDGFLIMSFLLALPFLAATGIAVARTRVLPAWLGWVTLALGIVMVTPVSWIFFFLGLPLWTLLVSVLLYLRGRAPAAAAG